jgi:GNAT superfamily N-acetyltransferase
VRRYAHADHPAIRATLLDVHAEVYAAESHDPFVQRFPWFVDHWGSHPGFACVVGYDAEGQAVGFAYGAPARPGGEWWRGDGIEEPERAGAGTFSVSELMVRERWRKTGTASALHAALLEDRPEGLAVLLVDQEHPKVQALYERWGYRKVGERQPFPDSPRFAVMLKELPGAGTGAG